MNKTYYVCKYTPIELLQAFGAQCENVNHMPEGFERADQIAHPNLCGFGKALLEAVMAGQIKELVLVNCCDTIRSVYDILDASGKLDFLSRHHTAKRTIQARLGEQKPHRKAVMETYGAHVIPSPSDTTNVGREILAEFPGTSGSLGCAISEAVVIST